MAALPPDIIFNATPLHSWRVMTQLPPDATLCQPTLEKPTRGRQLISGSIDHAAAYGRRCIWFSCNAVRGAGFETVS